MSPQHLDTEHDVGGSCSSADEDTVRRGDQVSRKRDEFAKPQRMRRKSIGRLVTRGKQPALDRIEPEQTRSFENLTTIGNTTSVKKPTSTSASNINNDKNQLLLPQVVKSPQCE